MQKPNKALSVLMIIVTSLGLLLSLFFLFFTWSIREPATVRLQAAATTTADILETTGQGLEIIDQVLVNVYSSTVALEDSATALADMIESSSVFVDSAGGFLGEGLINTITNTQTAIDSAQETASVIDNILNTLSRIPLIGIDYNPSRPLGNALGDVSESLDPIQGTLTDFQQNLQDTRTSMQEFSSQVQSLEQNISNINQNLLATQQTIDEYQTRLSSFQAWMENAIDQLPTWITTTCWIITLIIFWFMLIQVALMLQAINNLTGEKIKPDAISNAEISPIPMQVSNDGLIVDAQDESGSSPAEMAEPTRTSTGEAALQHQDAP